MTIMVEKPTGSEADLLALEAEAWPGRLPAQSIMAMIGAAARAHPDRFALTFLPTGAPDENPVRYTYAQLTARLTQAANLFSRLGVGRGDVVSILAPNLPQTVIALWAATAVGIANPINFLLNNDQLEGLLQAAGTKVLVCLGEDAGLGIWEKVDTIRPNLPHLQTVMTIGGRGPLDFDQALDGEDATHLTAPYQPGREDTAVYFHTGGTTGTPKLAVRTHDNEMYCAWAASQLWHYRPGDTVINVLPLFHVAGSIVSCLAPLACAAEVLFVSPVGLRHPIALKQIWRVAADYGATHLGGVPTHLIAMLDSPRHGLDLSRLRYTLTGGAALPAELGRKWRAAVGKPLTQIYGMTEGGATIAGSPPLQPPVEGSVGQRFPYGRWYLVDPNHLDQEISEAGKPGLVVIESPGNFKGYLDAGQNAGTLLENGAVVTGDLGYHDGRSNLFLCGRAKDLIIRSGHNIDPRIIEEALCSHPDVVMAAAVGKPDPYAGELPVAYVQTSAGSHCDEAQLLAFLAPLISERPAMPKAVYVIEAMPVTAVGKIYKPALRKEQLALACSNVLAHLEKHSFTFELRDDPLHGHVVEVGIPQDPEQEEPLRRQISEALGRLNIYVRFNLS